MPNGQESLTNRVPAAPTASADVLGGSGFELQPQTPPRKAVNIVLTVVLILFITAAGVVGFLVLRQRGYLGGMRSQSPRQNETVALPPGTVPIESYIPERPWQEGDPIPE